MSEEVSRAKMFTSHLGPATKDDQIQLKDLIEANRDLPLKDIKKGDRGIVIGIHCFDSEDYFDIELEDQRIVYLSCENCWNKV